MHCEDFEKSMHASSFLIFAHFVASASSCFVRGSVPSASLSIVSRRVSAPITARRE